MSRCVTKNISLYGNFSESGYRQRLRRPTPACDVRGGWPLTSIGVVLGLLPRVAFIELLGMILSICLCRNIHTEDYTKVPKY
ncbi:CD82 antigen-like protein [Lates japonicus]|uniref:CD82 antigen-like protein n=1 Tax=Lates japonicus TaxID=270547 RepID=A0AAD3N412_LATJO|nr:CD82 antigen-like protein [Lates japonicus]